MRSGAGFVSEFVGISSRHSHSIEDGIDCGFDARARAGQTDREHGQCDVLDILGDDKVAAFEQRAGLGDALPLQ
jgi:hypothetical protein